MLRIVEQRVWWPAALYSHLSLLLLAACATASLSRPYVVQGIRSKTPTQIEESFPALWEKWTVQFGATTRGKGLGFLSTALPMSGGPGGRGGEFPLHIAATLMDSTLIEAGLHHFAELIEMNPEEQQSFRRAYFDRYDPTEHLLIWCELRTRWAENFLNLDRWIIFIEDNQGDRCEPAQIIHEPPSNRHMVMEKPLAFQTEMERWEWETHSKRVMLCFPKRDYYGNLVTSERVKFLKLVFQLIDDRSARNEGMWMFPK